MIKDRIVGVLKTYLGKYVENIERISDRLNYSILQGITYETINTALLFLFISIRDWSIFIGGLGPVQKVIGHILFSSPYITR